MLRSVPSRSTSSRTARPGRRAGSPEPARSTRNLEAPLTLREHQRAETRRLFIEAAAACFEERGYAGTSVDNIARAAGATRATFYLHFSGKADVINELLATVAEETLPVHTRLSDAVAIGTREALRQWLDSAFDFWVEIAALMRAQDEAATLHPEVGQVRDEIFNSGVAAVVAGLERAGRGYPRTRQARGTLAYGQLQALCHRWLRRGWDTDRTVTLEVMTDVWMTTFAVDGQPVLDLQDQVG